MIKGISLCAGLLGLWLPLHASAATFGFADVVDKAKTLAETPYQAPRPVPKFLQDLSFHDYQGIRFKPENSLWHESNSSFQVMPVPPGLFYKHPVQVHIIDAQGVHPLKFEKNQFTYPNSEVERLVPADLGYAGFKLTFPLKQDDVQNQFLVFAGASYFRAVGRDNNFGISGRGLAVNTGLPGGEEFPDFVEFWLERPKPDAKSLTFYGLLNGKSLAGAYRFTVVPGEETVLQVQSQLFPRQSVELLGVAPLTSMFYYGENTNRPEGEWRPQVHDSDGLLIHDAPSDEWLWRPLRNPEALQMDYFATENVRGFGLLQRDTSFDNYMDLEARYDGRPSAWVAPEGDWGKGNVVLVQIPTPDETNDNIVAFWKPEAPVNERQPLKYDYKVHFGGPDIARSPLGRTQASYLGDGMRIGGGNEEGAVRLIIDFAGGPLDGLKPDAAVLGEVSMQQDGELIEHFVEYVAPLKRWRLSILARPAADRPLSLRAFLKDEQQTLTETWQYELPPSHHLLGRAR
ncbi:MAG: glucan biosynthesis protein G [Halopseudomonas sp.]|uniref:glucan biosynthesis protein n=1 Tax=Halopseudomonas sp. TaxID=2901191 RepID=UPI0030032DD7